MLKLKHFSMLFLVRPQSHRKFFDRNIDHIIPRDLIDFANISKEIVVSSSVDIIEIWDKRGYEDTIKDATVDFASLAEEVMGQDDD